MSRERVSGYCPMGCGSTLFLGEGGGITCSYIECPNPTAAAEILDDREREHVVVLTEDNFHVQHPLRERLNGELFGCEVHRRLSDLPRAPMKPGRYRVTLGGLGLDFEPLPGGTSA